MVKKPNKKSSAKSRIFTGIDFSSSRILVYILAFLVFAYFTGGYILQSDKRASIKNAKAIIDDVRALKLELEQKLGVSLSEDADCTQSSGKTDTKYSSWGCHIKIGLASQTVKATIDAAILQIGNFPSFSKFDSPTKLNIESRVLSFNHRTTNIPCQIAFNDTSFFVLCSFGVDNDTIGDVTKLLGIEQPKGNGRGIFL